VCGKVQTRWRLCAASGSANRGVNFGTSGRPMRLRRSQFLISEPQEFVPESGPNGWEGPPLVSASQRVEENRTQGEVEGNVQADLAKDPQPKESGSDPD
jgi:hypothetical protein